MQVSFSMEPFDVEKEPGLHGTHALSLAAEVAVEYFPGEHWKQNDDAD